MNATEPPTIPPEIMADMEAMAAAVSAGREPDPDLVRRVRDRADRVREELRRRYGEADLAVGLIREVRDEE